MQPRKELPNSLFWPYIFHSDTHIPLSPKRPEIDIIPRTGAGCLLLFGVVATGMAIPALFEGELAVFAFVFVLGLGTLAGGAYWLKNVLSADRRLKEQYEEKAILAVASRYEGNVTLGQISLETDLDPAETEAAMDRLCARGIARADILDDGGISYRFSGLLPRSR